LAVKALSSCATKGAFRNKGFDFTALILNTGFTGKPSESLKISVKKTGKLKIRLSLQNNSRVIGN